MTQFSHRRFLPAPPRPSKVRPLPEDHPAVVAGHSVYVSIPAERAPRVLVSAHNNPKIGTRVLKGEWRGMPQFTLTLEERATCPRSCQQWLDCYGNTMRWARRLRQGPVLEARLASEVAALAYSHPSGFVVRLHVLGDFYSVGYVELWGRLLDHFPELHIWGFTANRPWSRDPDERTIGEALRRVAMRHSRFRLRVSNVDTEVIDAPEEARGQICPAQLSEKASCGSCTFCWSLPQIISFLRHGRTTGGEVAMPPKAKPQAVEDRDPNPTIALIKDGQCRWPVRGEGAHMRFCGAEATRGSYCEAHGRDAFGPRETQDEK